MSLLDVSDLSVSYGLLAAVRSLHLTLDEGQVCVLLGANGAGKTSTLNAVSGAVSKQGGRVHFDGTDITDLAPYRIARLGLVHVPEGRRIIGPLSVIDNLLLGAYSVPKAQRVAALKDVYQLFPMLEEKKDQAGGLLSGGQQQMLAFGRALMARPKVMLLDEPSMGLAPVMVDRVMEAVRLIAATGIAVLMVEQNASAAFDVASSAHLVEHGHLLLHGPVEEVRRSPLVLRAFLGIEGTEAPE